MGVERTNSICKMLVCKDDMGCRLPHVPMLIHTLVSLLLLIALLWVYDSD